MIRDALTVMGKEWKEIMAMGGAQRGKFQLLLFVGVMGVFLPLQMGSEWVTSPAVIAVWGWVPVLMVSTVIADSFAGERERHTLETLLASRLSDSSILYGKMAAAVAYGWGLTLAGLVIGLITVNVAHREGGLLLYPATTAVGALLLSFFGAVLASAGGVLVSLRAQTVRQAQQTLSIATMVLFFVPVFGAQGLLPDSTKQKVAAWAVRAGTLKLLLTGIAALAVIDLLLIIAARARFRRPRLAVG
jgi:ABC-2 type transport system permease protein